MFNTNRLVHVHTLKNTQNLCLTNVYGKKQIIFYLFFFPLKFIHKKVLRKMHSQQVRSACFYWTKAHYHLILILMTSPNGNIFCVTGPLWGEFIGHRWIPPQRPVTRSFVVFFGLRLNKRLRKQPRRRWFETSSRPRHCNANFTEVCTWGIQSISSFGCVYVAIAPSYSSTIVSSSSLRMHDVCE